MWFHSLFSSWKSGRSRGRRAQPRPARRRTRLLLEHLEDRSLPSSFSAATVSDLIADIKAANTAGGANTITLTAPTSSPYELLNLYAADGGYNYLPVIVANDNLTIVGNGDTIDAPNPQTRFFDVAYLASLSLQNLTLQGGRAVQGGAIYNQGTATLSCVIVQYNQAEVAGGAICSNGSLTLENGTLVQGNNATAVGGGNASGGAVYVAGGTANITNTTITHNSVLAASNSTYSGGGLFVAGGTVTLTNDIVEFNSAASSGGGLYMAGGTVTLTNDIVEFNSAVDDAGGLYIAKGAAVYIDAFTAADIINNTAPHHPNIDGKYIRI